MVIRTYVSIIVFIFDVNNQLCALGALTNCDRIDLDDVNLSIDDLFGHIQAVHVGYKNVSVLFESVPIILGDHARQVNLLLRGQDRLDERVIRQVQDISLFQCSVHLLLLFIFYD